MSSNSFAVLLSTALIITAFHLGTVTRLDYSDSLTRTFHRSAYNDDEDGCASNDIQCLADSFAVGEWSYDDNAHYPYFYSAGEDMTIYDKYSQCDIDQSAIEKDWFLADIKAQRAWKNKRLHGLLNTTKEYVRPALKYVWRPLSSSLRRRSPLSLPSLYTDKWLAFPSNPVEFCRALNNRPLLMVGDSHTGQMYLSLFKLVNATYHTPTMLTYPSDPYFCHRTLGLTIPPTSPTPSSTSSTVPHTDADADVGPLLSYVRHDYATLNDQLYDATPSSTIHHQYEHPFIPYLYNHSILIINRGLHYKSNDIVLKQLNETITFILNKYSNIIIIYRSSVGGHYHWNTLAAIRPYTYTEYLSRHNDLIHKPPDEHMEWGWHLLYKQNELIKNLLIERLRTSKYSRTQHVIYMNIHNMTSLRIDGHSDYVHYCLPGPIDTWNIMLYNILNAIKSSSTTLQT